MSGDGAPDLAARAEIATVLARYCHALDRRRWDLLEACFEPDATFAFGPIRGGWREFAAAAQQMIDPLLSTHHQLGQTLHAFSGKEARTETYMTATHQVAGDALPEAIFPGRGAPYEVVIAGRYIDHFVRGDRGWRIARRTGMIDWRREAPLTPDMTMPRLDPADDPAFGLCFTQEAGEYA